eukprot:3310602-Pyramimonas_sp.AAC.1
MFTLLNRLSSIKFAFNPKLNAVCAAKILRRWAARSANNSFRSILAPDVTFGTARSSATRGTIRRVQRLSTSETWRRSYEVLHRQIDDGSRKEVLDILKRVYAEEDDDIDEPETNDDTNDDDQVR